MYKFFGTILGFFSNICGGSYFLGLLLFAIMIKLILLPFGIKQQKNAIRQAKMKPKALQTILGHSNIGITMNLYVHTTEEQKHKEIDLVADALKVI